MQQECNLAVDKAVQSERTPERQNRQKDTDSSMIRSEGKNGEKSGRLVRGSLGRFEHLPPFSF